MAVLILGENVSFWENDDFSWEVKNIAGYYPGPAKPSTADGDQLGIGTDHIWKKL